MKARPYSLFGPMREISILIASASSEGSGDSVHNIMRRFDRALASQNQNMDVDEVSCQDLDLASLD